ncbi:lecithin-cholesterol acyltransferase-like 1 [Miscanthus floridulus]|uniref:lecithin-cholesterol acyltransferase-like 1 n=1 Tax=Miscanthus floridulus TaxID=154761 RepID=UPI00345AF50B
MALEAAADVRCFAEQMAAVYDAASDDYRNAPGVETRVPFFGSTRGFRYPDPDRRNFSYMDKFVSRLERRGYRDDETLFGSPYDFRYAVEPPGHPSSVGDAFFGRLKRLVERASRINGGMPVTIVAYSYGGTLGHQFLLRRPLPWRRRFVPVAAPWAGVVLGMLTLVAGNNLGLPFVDPLALRGEYRSLQSSLWPLPNTNAFGAGQPLVTTRSRTYTANDVADFLDAIGPYQSRVLPLFRELPSPRVPVACVVGVGVDTPEMLAYRGDDFDLMPRMVMVGDGDGLVNLASLLAVDPAWRRPAAYFRMLKVRNVSHTGLFGDDAVLAVIISAILHPQLISQCGARSPAGPPHVPTWHRSAVVVRLLLMLTP